MTTTRPARNASLSLTLLALISLFLAASTITTIVLTDDPNWAKWHISYLGEADSFSAHFFNVSLWVAGWAVVGLALAVGRDLAQAKARTKRFANSKPRLVAATLAAMGLCVYLVGLFPRSFGIFPHDIFGHGIYFLFLFLCLISPWILPGMKAWFYGLSYGFHVVMVGLFVLYWTGMSESLYEAEIATFVFFLGWLGLVIRETRKD